jgi:hypothetical protein
MGFQNNKNMVWDTTTLAWVAMTQPGSASSNPYPSTYKSVAFSLSSTGTVVSSVASKRIKVFSVKMIASAALSVNFRDGASTNLEGAQPLAANAGYIESVFPTAYLFATSAGNSLDLVITGGGTASGRVSYWDSDAT